MLLPPARLGARGVELLLETIARRFDLRAAVAGSAAQQAFGSRNQVAQRPVAVVCSHDTSLKKVRANLTASPDPGPTASGVPPGQPARRHAAGQISSPTIA
ncbi:hypothetical protein WJ974_16115 [Achromobacter xylosoxidans]